MDDMMENKMTISERIHFGVVSLVHETLYGLFRDPNKALHAAGLQPGQQVLEVGCGPGFFTIPAARIVGEQGLVYAFDVNPLAIARVRKKVGEANVTNVKTVLADAAQTGLPDASFDLIFLFGLEHYRGDMKRILTEADRLLKPAGILAAEGELWRSSQLFRPLGRQGRISQFSRVNDDLDQDR
jgi:ubiquinone/menaquinone biosynthesis C-methylase UbiE